MLGDILVILACILAVVAYYSLPARRASGLARTAKAEAASRAGYQRTLLRVGVLASLAFMSAAVYIFVELSVAMVLIATVVLTLLWYIILREVWKLTEKRRLIADAVAWLVLLPLFIVSIALSDLSLWQKLAYPIGAICVGHGIFPLTRYIDRRLESRRSSKKGK